MMRTCCVLGKIYGALCQAKKTERYKANIVDGDYRIKSCVMFEIFQAQWKIRSLSQILRSTYKST